MGIISDLAETVAVSVGSIFKTSLPTYCDVETADSDKSLVTSNGTLIGGIRLDGLGFPMGPEEFESVVDAITRALQAFLAHGGHTLDVFASRDPAAVARKLAALSAASRKSCEAIGLNVSDVIESNERELRKYAAVEEIYLALWTREAVLSEREVKDGRKELAAAAAKMPKIGWAAQNPICTNAALRERHDATMRSVLEDLNTAGIACEQLTAHEMLRIARKEIDPDFTPDDWRPHLVGDAMPLVQTPAILRGNQSRRELDSADLQYPPVSWQVFPRDAQRLNAKYAQVGDRAYAPVFVEIAPREIMPFAALFEKLANAKLPWRCLIRIDGGGMKYAGVKQAVAELLSIGSSHNRRVAQSFIDMKAVKFDGNTDVRFRMSFCTWAPAGNEGLLRQRASRLAQNIAAWGQCEVREVSGDSVAGMISTVPFLSETCIGNASVAPLAHISRLLPIMRPMSPWKQGSMIFRTMDGRLMPFQPGSSRQTTWNYIFFGRPGFGKSAQMLNLILSSCMEPGLNKLPRVGIVDIGPSSDYFVSTIRDSLLPQFKHLAAGFKLSMTVEQAINPFDTPLGCRFPTAEHKAFIVSILSQIATPAEAEKPYPRISELTSKVVDDVYAQYADTGSRANPKRYAPGVEPRVDQLLESHGFTWNRDTAWWHVVDFLFAKGHTHEATMAQRYAVPLVPDCVALSKQSVDMYQKIKVESGETLTEAFSSLISSATRDFPNLSAPTKFDIGEVRVAAINLEEVAKGGSAAAIRQTAVMYMLAGYALTKDYRLDQPTVESMQMPAQYLDYHMDRMREIQSAMKWIAWDEFHRTSKSIAVQDAVTIDQREGRKFKIGVILSSQGAGDFPETMREFATGVFVMDAGTEKNARALQAYFGFNDTTRQLMSQYATGPTSAGAPLLASITTKKGTFTQLLVSTLGPTTRWALSTTSEDVLVRRAVCARLGPIKGRAALTATYPDGAQAAVERLQQAGEPKALDIVANDAVVRWEQARLTAA